MRGAIKNSHSSRNCSRVCLLCSRVDDVSSTARNASAADGHSLTCGLSPALVGSFFHRPPLCSPVHRSRMLRAHFSCVGHGHHSLRRTQLLGLQTPSCGYTTSHEWIAAVLVAVSQVGNAVRRAAAGKHEKGESRKKAAAAVKLQGPNWRVHNIAAEERAAWKKKKVKVGTNVAVALRRAGQSRGFLQKSFAEASLI